MSQSDNRSIRQIEADIEATRTQLAETIDQLVYRTKPATIAQRQSEAAKVAFTNATRTDTGELRYDRLAILTAVTGVLLAIAIVRRAKH